MCLNFTEYTNCVLVLSRYGHYPSAQLKYGSMVVLFISLPLDRRQMLADPINGFKESSIKSQAYWCGSFEDWDKRLNWKSDAVDSDVPFARRWPQKSENSSDPRLVLRNEAIR